MKQPLSFTSDHSLNPGNFVYKFCPPEGVDYLLREQVLRFSRVSRFNDCFEALGNFHSESYHLLEHAVKVFIPELDNPELSHLAKDNLASEFLETVEGRTLALSSSLVAVDRKLKLVENLGILCLAKHAASPLMWGMYAASYSGICVGFNPESKVFSDSELAPGVAKGLNEVTYSNERNHSTDPYDLNSLAERLTTKFEQWGYEEEVRCFRTLGTGCETMSVPFEGSDVREVIIGYRMTPFYRERVFQVLRSRFPGVTPFIAIPSTDKPKMIVLSANVDWKIVDSLRSQSERNWESASVLKKEIQ